MSKYWCYQQGCRSIPFGTIYSLFTDPNTAFEKVLKRILRFSKQFLPIAQSSLKKTKWWLPGISLKIYKNRFFASVPKSPTQMGSLGVNNSFTNYSRFGTLKAWNFFSFFYFCGVLQKGNFLDFFYVLYSTLLLLPPRRFHCVGGCWDRFCPPGSGSGSSRPNWMLIHADPDPKQWLYVAWPILKSLLKRPWEKY